MILRGIRGRFCLLFALLLSIFCLVTSAYAFGDAKPNTPMQLLKTQVAAMNLGLNGYHIGHKITTEQKEIAEINKSAKAFQGTYKFNDGEIFVVVNESNDVILAVGKNKNDASSSEMKSMISDLMIKFGNPTLEAHETLIYWAFDARGKLTSEVFKDIKKDEKVLDVLATIKFKSKLSFDESSKEDAPENSIHVIISSPRMLEEFFKK